MTKEFEEIVNRLARARNFEDGSYILVTSEPDSEDIKIEAKGNYDVFVPAICDILNEILSKAKDNKAALIVREKVKKVIIEDEQRRFQNNNSKRKFKVREEQT